MVEAEEKIIKLQIAGFRTKLGAFKFIENTILEKSEFYYLKSDGEYVRVSVADLMEDGSLLVSVNEEVAEDVKIKQEADAKKALELKLEIDKAQEAKKIADEAALKTKLDAQARKT